MTNLRDLTDEQLEAHRVEVLIECERRQKMDAIPDQVRDLAKDYKDGGGDPTILEKAISGEDAPAE